MKRVLVASALSVTSLVAVIASSPVTKPEDVGLSSERLQRITQMIQRRIASGDIAGAVTVVARRGRIAHLAAQGVMDLQAKQPMSPQTMFRIASMTKPVVGTSIMMLIEEGKLHLNDPVWRYIPSFRNMRVAVAEPEGRGETRPATAAVLHRAGPARHHDQGSADARVGPRQRTDE